MEPIIDRSSEQLMMAVARGDLDAFNEIVLRHQKLAWGIAYRFLGDRHEAEDVAQEAFLRILGAASRYRPTAALPTYLSRIVTRLCLDHARKKRPVPTDNLAAVSAGNPSVADQVAVRDRDQLVRAALGSLPPAQRMAVVLRYFEGLDCRSVALAMETTVKAIERLLARARETLQPLLGGLLDKSPNQ
jgi:RNA polymerase sigma-70 factor (ECF subfamily)